MGIPKPVKTANGPKCRHKRCQDCAALHNNYVRREAGPDDRGKSVAADEQSDERAVAATGHTQQLWTKS